MAGDEVKDKEEGFTIMVDGEPYETPNKTMTANAILALAELSSAEYYLIEIRGGNQESYQGRGEESIHLHQKAKFISVFVGPTTVAHASLTGAALFAAQLRAAGYDVAELGDEHVTFKYTVDVGKHAGLEVKLGFVVPADFPLIPPHGPHIDRRFYPDRGGGSHPTGGIHCSTKHSKHFGKGWEHWSRPHPSWSEGNRDAVRYMAFVRSLWSTQ